MSNFHRLRHPVPETEVSRSHRRSRPVVASLFLAGLLCLAGSIGVSEALAADDSTSTSDSFSYCDTVGIGLSPLWCEAAGDRVACHSPASAEGEVPAHGGERANPSAPWSSVYRDAATGRFRRPPAGVSVAFSRATQVPKMPLVERRVKRPGGGVRVVLSERFSTAVVAKRLADGTLEIDCGEPEIDRVVDQAAPGEEIDR